jgi:xanthine dehydrogenase accessory factor
VCAAVRTSGAVTGRLAAMPVLVLGAGDVGSAVAHGLSAAGHAVALQDGPAPSAAPRRGMAFADAWFDGGAVLAGLAAARIDGPGALAPALAGSLPIPLLACPVEEALAAVPWTAVVDARMRKRDAPADLRSAAPLSVGLGPGFVAGGNCHIAVETSWEALGAVIDAGPTLPLRGEPRPIGGAGRGRAAYAPAEGVFRTAFRIGDRVAGDVVATIGGQPVRAPLEGVLRGLVRDGVHVRAGAKVVEVDPRGDPALCFGLGERPRRIAAAVAAILATRQARS